MILLIIQGDLVGIIHQHDADNTWFVDNGGIRL